MLNKENEMNTLTIITKMEKGKGLRPIERRFLVSARVACFSTDSFSTVMILNDEGRKIVASLRKQNKTKVDVATGPDEDGFCEHGVIRGECLICPPRH